jgi:hypothetical protein
MSQDEIRKYLDEIITIWRERRQHSMDNDYSLMCKCYIDAYQSVRATLFGEILP